MKTCTESGSITSYELAKLYGDARYCLRLDYEGTLDEALFDVLAEDLATKVAEVCRREGFDYEDVCVRANMRLLDALACVVGCDMEADRKLMEL